jgi:Ca2+-binding EF-hand superfamily protein
MDADGNGLISRNEFMAAAESRFNDTDRNGDGLLSQEEKKQARWAKVDTNGDGFISRSEFIAQAEKRFNDMDRNGDGLISRDEYEPMRQEPRGNMKYLQQSRP